MEIDALSTTTCELKGRRWPRPSAKPLRPPAASPRVSSRPPSMLHADVRTNIHSLSHLTPLTPPGRRPAEARCEVRPVRRRRSRPVAATDRRRPFLIAATGSACDSGTWPDGSARLVGRLTTWPNNLPFRRARHPFLFLPWFLQEESHHVFGTHLPEGSWQGRESPPCCVRH